MIELLAPAGDEKSFFAAINNGADAVYLGLSDFSARKSAANFSTDNLGYYVSYAHVLGAKVYVAINTLVKNNEIKTFFEIVSKAYESGVDAFIVQDVFLAKPLKEAFPNIVLHLSTQGGVNNLLGAKYALKFGFSRVILARETALDDIEEIAKAVETEVFVQGALCSSFSGHCYMSSFIGGNSGNRGYCKQPCRKKYSLETKVGDGEYAISLADLNLSGEIDKLNAIGVKSVKIEGRMRTPEYVAAAVRLYRAAIDGAKVDTGEISRTFNRGDYTKGYLYGVNQSILSDKTQSHIGEKIGTVKSVLGDKLQVESRGFFKEGDCFKILRLGKEVGNAVCLKSGKTLGYKGNVKIGDEVRITKDCALTESLLGGVKRVAISVTARAVVGEKLKLSAEGITVESEDVLARAKTSALTSAELADNLRKTDKYPFEITSSVTVEGEPFIPKSKLNSVRAELYSKVFESKNSKVKVNGDFEPEKLLSLVARKEFAYDRIVITDSLTLPLGDRAIRVCFPDDYDNPIADVNDAYLYVPTFLSGRDVSKIKDISSKFKGFYVDGLVGLALAEEVAKPFVVGSGLNVFNSVDVYSLYSLGAEAVVASKESSLREIEDFGSSVFTFTRGAIRLMELEYCPFGKKCRDCKRGNKFVLRDELGHKFTLRRYRLNGRCRFEVYNDAALYSQVRQAEVINLIGIDSSSSRDIIDGNAKVKERMPTTIGNLSRGVK